MNTLSQPFLTSLSFHSRFRRFKNLFMITGLLILSTLAVMPFFFIAFHVLSRGWGELSLSFFTELPRPVGSSGGGMANALIGSTLILTLASLMGIPWGVGLGVYLSEYGKEKTAFLLRLTLNLLMSAPSIVIGIFIYGVVVTRFGFSSYAGSAALLLILLPVVAKGTEEILKIIPTHIREAGLAIGLSRWQMILRILLPGALAQIITVLILAVARVAGETAPLLFTALGNQFHIQSLSEPVATLPVQIYEFSKSGFPSQERQAWTGALVLILFVFLINLCTRATLFFYRKYPSLHRTEPPAPVKKPGLKKPLSRPAGIGIQTKP